MCYTCRFSHHRCISPRHRYILQAVPDAPSGKDILARQVDLLTEISAQLSASEEITPETLQHLQLLSVEMAQLSSTNT